MDAPDDNLYAPARNAMIAHQLTSRGITSAAVLHAMAAVPRHLFVAPEFRSQSYEDCALPAANGQSISQPFMVALMTQLLNVQPTSRILEIGTGTGYQTAILSRLAPHGHIFTIERLRPLAESAQSLLASLGLANIHFLISDGSLGWPTGEGRGERVEGQAEEIYSSALSPLPSPLSPSFDRILITAGTPEIPRPILDQLADPGTLVAPVGNEESQRLVVITRKNGNLSEHLNLSCRFVPLIGEHGWKPEPE